MAEFINTYLKETSRILAALDRDAFEKVASGLSASRDAGGRLFVLGVGGSAGHASHAVNDSARFAASKPMRRRITSRS